MRIRIPYGKTKRYLTGMDWVIGALGRMNRRATGGTNASQIVLDLQGAFDVDRFRERMTEFVQLFPVLAGRPARDWNLAPYWKTPRRGHPVPVTVTVEDIAASGMYQSLERSANLRLPVGGTVAFRVFRISADRRLVAFHFDHSMFDAHGAESFLELFHRWSSGEDCREAIDAIALTEPAHLSDWMRKFESGKQLVRLLRRFSATTPRAFVRPPSLRGRPFRFRVLSFDESDTRAIVERADREAGFLMFTPYTMAVALQAMDGICRASGVKGEDYIVSTSVDLRAPETAPAQLFFNHMSFLFFQIPATAAGDPRQTMSLVRTQMYEQIKAGFPRALYDSGMLMRILPLSLLSRLMLVPLRGEFASMGFTCVGQSTDVETAFMEARVENLFHMPLVPVPPGIALFINRFGRRMNVVLSYLDGLLDDDAAARFEADLRRLL